MTVGSSTLQVTGVQAHSGSNVAAWSIDSQIIGGVASMLADYADSHTITFDLHSFWYGCAGPTLQGAVGLPTTCTITVRGYNVEGSIVGIQTFNYNPTGLEQQMVQGILSAKFTGLKTVKFSTSAILVGLLDSVEYTAFLS
jgi:hypothetical protein